MAQKIVNYSKAKSSDRVFHDKVSEYLKHKLSDLLNNFGPKDLRYLALARQYLKSPLEESEAQEVNLRHYEAELSDGGMEGLRGIERLYRRTMVIELTMSCATHCRYCLRQNYDLYTLTEHDIEKIAKYCGSDQLKNDVNEVLITGGDPFLVPKSLSVLVESLMRYAPNVTILRVATRLPQHDPDRVSNAVLDVFRNKAGLKFEIATQINHSVELFPEVRDCFIRLKEVVPTIYSQNVLLKGVNDTKDALVELYERIRSLGIEAHYLFHAVPMRGTSHFRTSVDTGLNLARQITSCGIFSGRAKPMFAAMTDIGKIVFYEGTILERDKGSNRILLKSGYQLEERLKWNPSWRMPSSASVDKDGYLNVWYLDGAD